MKTFFLVYILSIFSIAAWAGDGIYAVANIPAALLKNSDIVKREEEIRFEIQDIGKAKEYHKYVLTVLNENGNKQAFLEEYYDKLQSIESISGTLYDATGKKIKSLKKSDIEDKSGTSDINLADDNRIKYHNFFYKVYPYTVEYEIEIKYNYTMFFPGWMPQENEHYAVQESKLSVVCPQNYQFRYKAFNYSKEPEIQSEKSNKIYTWEIKDLQPIESEYASPYWFQITPVVCLGPDQFQIEGYKGDMGTWQDFGKFVYALKQGRDELPDDIKQKVHQMTDGLSDPKEKIRKLYEFLQQNTRYISVQLGIGGWQPFDAKYVASKRYGDCKALSNYMFSLLKEVGIKSFYTLIKAGENNQYMISDFPSSQFNHVILCVPLEEDSMWLECTSQTLPAGYLSGFTSNRFALLIDENGGKLVRTPKYGYNENLQLRKINATLNDEGNLSASVNANYRALQQDDLEGMINYLSKDKVLEYLKKSIDLPTYDISKFDYKQEKNILPPVINEYLELTASNYAQVTGKRLFINPNILNRSYRKLKIDEERKYDIELTDEFREIDSVEIKIPAGYQPESVPADMKIENKFGKYITSTKLMSDKIIYYRLREQYGGKFLASEYANLVKYYEQLYKADRNKVVLVKK